MSNAKKMRPDGMPVGTPFGPDNPPPPNRGRPKGSRNIRSILQDLLDLPKKLDESGEEVSRLEYICAKLVNMAQDGDLASIDRVFDRLEGKPVVKAHNENTNINVETDVREVKTLTDEQLDAISAILKR